MYMEDVPDTVLSHAESYCRERSLMWQGMPVAEAYSEAADRMFDVYKERDCGFEREIDKLLGEKRAG